MYLKNTFIDQERVASVVPTPMAPKRKFRVLQSSEDSTYTFGERKIFNQQVWRGIFPVFRPPALCSPVLVPQMVGGFGPSGLVTPNVSVRHWVKSVTGTVPPEATTPAFFMRFVTSAAFMLGPVNTKFSKSNLSWGKKLSDNRGILWRRRLRYLAYVVIAGAYGGLARSLHDGVAVEVGAVLAGHAAAGDGN